MDDKLFAVTIYNNAQASCMCGQCKEIRSSEVMTSSPFIPAARALCEVGTTTRSRGEIEVGWWPVLVCSERRVLLAGCGWLLVTDSF
jgi:hypothetical protein